MTKTTNNFYKITAEKDVTKAARLDLFGVIGGGFFEVGFDENTFKNEMSVVSENQPLDIYINSSGGSVFTAIAIYNQICRHKGEVKIYVAGMAASAATIITSTPNAKVIMPIGSMMLIHPVRLYADGMTPEEMKKAAENLEKVRASVVDIYAKKTGLDEAKLLDLMSDENYLTPKEAVELGFADEVDESEKTAVKNSIVGNVVMVNDLEVNASMFDRAPKDFLKIADANAPAVSNQATKEEEKPMTLEKLKAEHPEIVDAIRKEAVNAERSRIQAIEEIGNAEHAELVNKAKFTEPMTAEQLAVAMLKADKAKKETMLKNRVDDAAALNGIAPVSNSGIQLNAEQKANEEKELNDFINAGKAAFKA